MSSVRIPTELPADEAYELLKKYAFFRVQTYRTWEKLLSGVPIGERIQTVMEHFEKVLPTGALRPEAIQDLKDQVLFDVRRSILEIERRVERLKKSAEKLESSIRLDIDPVLKDQYQGKLLALRKKIEYNQKELSPILLPKDMEKVIITRLVEDDFLKVWEGIPIKVRGMYSEYSGVYVIRVP